MLASSGRQKGTLNKTSALLKDAILEAADIAGGKAGLVGYLALQARENPVAFMGLLGKLVPSQIAAEVTQNVATVTDEMMTPEEWAEQWAERMAWVKGKSDRKSAYNANVLT